MDQNTINVTENTAVETTDILQGISIPEIPTAAPKTNQVMSGVLLGFAGLGVVESLGLAGFGVYKLVKHIKAKKAIAAKAEPVVVTEEIPVEVEQATE